MLLDKTKGTTPTARISPGPTSSRAPIMNNGTILATIAIILHFFNAVKRSPHGNKHYDYISNNQRFEKLYFHELYSHGI